MRCWCSCGLFSLFSYQVSVCLLLLCQLMQSWFGLCGVVMVLVMSLLCVSSEVMCVLGSQFMFRFVCWVLILVVMLGMVSVVCLVLWLQVWFLLWCDVLVMMMVWWVCICLVVSGVLVLVSGWCGVMVQIQCILFSLCYCMFRLVGGLLVVLMIRLLWFLVSVFQVLLSILCVMCREMLDFSWLKFWMIGSKELNLMILLVMIQSWFFQFLVICVMCCVRCCMLLCSCVVLCISRLFVGVSCRWQWWWLKSRVLKCVLIWCSVYDIVDGVFDRLVVVCDRLLLLWMVFINWILLLLSMMFESFV